MRKEFYTLLLFFLSALMITILLVSCAKEYSCEGCRELNKPPLANAGTDQVITLPTDSVSLDGTNSSDPDGTITEWVWRKISGSATFNIVMPSESKTVVRNLAMDTYQFELKVTDAGGLYDMDTVQVTVLAETIDCNTNTAITSCDGSRRPVVCAQLTPIGTLSQARDKIAVASAGNKIVFAGG